MNTKRIKALLKVISLLFLSLLPSRIKIFILNRCGHSIHSTCHIGICFLDIKKIELMPHASISSLNIFKGLTTLSLGDHTRIGGRLNWFTASNLHNKGQEGFGAVEIGDGSNITGRHFFDAQNKISIGRNTLIAGFRTTFWTHGYRNTIQKEKSGILIGDHCYIGSQSIFVSGGKIGNYCFVGAGSVIVRDFSENTFCLIAGNPAEVRKIYEKSDNFFSQEHKGFVPN